MIRVLVVMILAPAATCSDMPAKRAFRYRCSRRACRARRSLPRRIEEYVREPKCRCCGARLTLDVTRQRKGASEGRRTCYCDGAHFPHREGSLLLCRHSTKPITGHDWEAIRLSY